MRAGHELQEDQRQADQKRLLLERFQAEVGGYRRGAGHRELLLLLLLLCSTAYGTQCVLLSQSPCPLFLPPPLQHPGFDFSSAEFSGGAVPDPRTFMRDLNQQ